MQSLDPEESAKKQDGISRFTVGPANEISAAASAVAHQLVRGP